MRLTNVPRLIKKARVASLQTDFGDEYGISDEVFLIALQNAQTNLQKYLIMQNGEAFPAYHEITLVPGTYSYSLPDEIVAGNLIHEVAFSPTGLSTDYDDPLKWGYWIPTPVAGDPVTAYVSGNLIYLDAVPAASGGTVRVRYERELAGLDIPRGTVETATQVGGEYVFDLSETGETYYVLDQDDDAFTPIPDYISLYNRDGTFQEYGLRVNSYDSAAHQISCEAKTLDGTLLDCRGRYVAIGYRASEFPEVESIAEQYFIEYAKNEVILLNSSTDITVTNPRLASLLEEIAEVYAKMGQRPMPIPQTRGED